MIEDRPYQTRFVNETLRLLRAGAAGIVQYAPTGAGKTEMDVRVAKTKIEESGAKVCAFVHRDNLADQWMKRFAVYGVRAQLLDASSDAPPDPRADAYVAMLPTIDARLERPSIRSWLSRLTLPIWDEAHHCPADQWQRAMALAGGQHLGPTATPWRMDGKGLGDCGFNATVSAPHPRELIRLGYLAPFRAYAPPMPELDLASVGKVGADYNQGDIQRMVDTEVRLRQAVRWYTKFAGGLPAFGFATGVNHAENMAAMFRRFSWAACSVSGGTDGVDDILKQLGRNAFQMVSSCQKLYEGTDVPAVACVIDDAPTMSTQRYIQRVGRGLRTHEDKTDAVVLDLVGNIATHGMPDAERPWTLHGGVKGLERQVAPTCRCPRCWRVFEEAPACPECGLHQLKAKGAVAGPVWHLPSVAGHRPEVIAAKTLGDAVKVARSRTDLERIAAIKGVTDAGWVSRMTKHFGLEGVLG